MWLLRLLRIRLELSASSRAVYFLARWLHQISAARVVSRIASIACLCALVLKLSKLARRALKDGVLFTLFRIFDLVICFIEVALQSLRERGV